MNIKINVFQVLSHLPALLLAGAAIGTDVERLQADPEIVKELESNPVLKTEFAHLADEWQTVSADARGVDKSTFFNFFGRTTRLLKDVDALKNTATADAARPEILAALETAPKTKAGLEAISAQFRAFEEAL